MFHLHLFKRVFFNFCCRRSMSKLSSLAWTNILAWNMDASQNTTKWKETIDRLSQCSICSASSLIQKCCHVATLSVVSVWGITCEQAAETGYSHVQTVEYAMDSREEGSMVFPKTDNIEVFTDDRDTDSNPDRRRRFYFCSTSSKLFKQYSPQYRIPSVLSLVSFCFNLLACQHMQCPKYTPLQEIVAFDFGSSLNQLNIMFSLWTTVVHNRLDTGSIPPSMLKSEYSV